MGRFREIFSLPQKYKVILILFLVIGALWGLFYTPTTIKPHDWLLNIMDNLMASVDNFFVALIVLVIVLVLGIFWLILWLASLLKIQYAIFGALYIGLYGLLFVVLLHLFLKLFGAKEYFLYGSKRVEGAQP